MQMSRVHKGRPMAPPRPSFAAGRSIRPPLPRPSFSGKGGKGGKTRIVPTVKPEPGLEDLGPAAKKPRRSVGEIGEVEYFTAEDANLALQYLDGSALGDSTLSIMTDKSEPNGTRLVVYGLPAGVSEEDMQDHFGQVGPMAGVNLMKVSPAGVPGPTARPETGHVVPPKRTPLPRPAQRQRVLLPTRPAAERKLVKEEDDEEDQPEAEAEDGDLLELGMIGEVRYTNPQDAEKAIDELQGSECQGNVISVEADEHSLDGSKVIVKGLPLGIEWQEVKDHFSQCGHVSFASVRLPPLGPAAQAQKIPPPIPGTGVGEVRYDSPADTRRAVMQLNGSLLNGYPITLQMDATSKDGTKLIVYGIAPGVEWQEMKDHFGRIGVVAFANITSKATIRLGKGGASIPHAFTLMTKGKSKGLKGMCGMHGMHGFPAAGPMERIGEVRFETNEHATIAMQELNGSVLCGSEIHIQLDAASQDKTKCVVYGIPPGIEWQELKDHFAAVGPVKFANIFSPPPSMFMATPTGPTERPMRQISAKGARPSVSSSQMAKGVYQNAPWRTGSVSEGPVGEVRFDDPGDVEAAIEHLDGIEVEGYQLSVERDTRSREGSKISVKNLPPGIKWQELKDLCMRVGHVAFVEVRQ